MKKVAKTEKHKMSSKRRLSVILSQLKCNKVINKEQFEYVLITGCSRGIGYGLVQKFLNSSDNRYFVIASCRSPQKAHDLKILLSKHSNRSLLIKLDTSSQQSIINAVKTISQKQLRIDILINNAAIVSTKVPSYKETVTNFDNQEFQHVLNVNLIGPASLFKHCFNQNILASNARIVNITSNVASLTKDTHGNYFSYRISKAALNMLTVLQQMQIGNKHCFKICCIDPGHVQTKMGLEQSGFDTAPLTVNESCNGILKIINNMYKSDHYNGKFMKYDGSMLQF